MRGLTQLVPHLPACLAGREGHPGLRSPLLLVGQHGLGDGELVGEAGPSDELGDAAGDVHGVCGHRER